ncbi:MAG: phosphomannomutase/phosphoglucomutase, partial [Nanoarchaeota archaeon]|nr:phosphomannomutase/phosphoglucomutase [Nanoarchaeota archaeon]
EKSKEKGIVYNVPCGKIAAQTAHNYGLKSWRTRVGHTSMKKSMREHDAFFGCEHSGHYYYKKNFYADSAVITSLIVCEIFSREKSKGFSFSQMLQPFQKYIQFEEKNIRVHNQEAVLAKILSRYKKLGPRKVDSFDGLTIEFPKWWFNVRPSRSGEQYLRVNVEADNKPLLRQKRTELLRFIRQNSHTLP